MRISGECLRQAAAQKQKFDVLKAKVDKIAHLRKRMAQTMRIAKAPRSTKGKSLRESPEKGPVPGVEAKKELSPGQRQELLAALEARFEKNMNRHKGLEWAKVKGKLEANTEKLWSLNEMERTGGEPDVGAHDNKTGEYIFCDCSAETPKGRRNVCYDHEGQEKREKQGLHPGGNVIDMAAAIGIEPLTEEQYRELQELGEFDTKTQSWLKTPADIRKLGGAIFADPCFGRVFVYHNTAPCFYGSRAFRGLLRV